MANKSKKPTYDSSTVWLEVKNIIGKSTGTSLFDYKGILHTEKEDMGIWDINPILTERDYLTNIGDTRVITFKMPMGDYVNRLHPFRDNLEFTLKRTPINESGSRRKPNKEIAITRYKAIFNPKNNPPVGASDIEMYHIQDLNTIDLVEVQIELCHRSLEPFRIKTTDGVYKNQTLATFLNAIIGHEANQVLVDGKPCIDAINIVDPDNATTIPHITVPTGTRVVNLPTFLQNELGIYNRGIGTFFQNYRGKRTLFVYPTYDTERFDGKEPRVVFYAVPQEKLPQLDRSYTLDGDILKVAVTAQRKYTDSAELGMMNGGNGFRMPDARSFMKKPVLMSKDGPVGSRAQLNHELVVKNRKDGLDYAPVVQGGPSNNPYIQKSKVLQNSLGQLDLVWENADEELIYPGMPCRYTYLSQGKAISVNGTILFVHGMTTRVGKYNTQAYRTTVRLSIAVEAFKHIPDIDYAGVKGEIDNDLKSR